MSTSEQSLGVSTGVPSDAGAAQAVGATSPSPTTTDTSLAQSGTASNLSAENVQGAEGTQPDPFDLQGLPSDQELEATETVSKKAFLQIKSAFDPLKSTYKELQAKYSPYETALSRFEQPEQLQEVLDLRDNLIGWTNDPATGEPVPSTEKGADFIHERYPQHASDLVGQLIEKPVFDSVTGRTMSRWDVLLLGVADDPAEKAKVARIFGLVEPSANAPQWQPSEEELALVKPELQDIYRKLPYEEREELKLASPEFINRQLEKEKFQQELMARDKQTQASQLEQQQQRESYVNSQAQAAAQSHVDTQLQSALATFHESVVQQCNFIKPLDPANLPQGMSPEQATQMNSQIAASNKAEAAQITGLVVSLFNPQTKAYVLPLLKEIGAVDDKLLAQLDAASSTFGNNARNYGNLTYRHQLTANGNGYQPDQAVTQMSNEASRALKSMIGYANQIKGRLMESRSNFFSLKAQDHNSTLNGAGTVRPPLNGQGYNPTTASPARPQGFMTRDEITQRYG